MASLPARQPSQRRQTPPDTSSPQSQAPAVSPVRARSEDSQTIFVHRTDDDREEHEAEQQQEADFGSSQPPQQQSRAVVNAEDDEDAIKCWICYRDKTELAPDLGPWRDPCPCSLTAHEGCLLDWIADIEANSKAQTRGLGAPRFECPQCKSEIKLARPRDYLVDAVRGLETLGNRAVTPGSILALSGVLYNCSMAIGFHSIYAVFGAEDGTRILQPLIDNANRPPIEVYAGSPREASQQLLKVVLDHAVHWRLYAGLPLITPVLILSRTTYADGILPVLPVVFFASLVRSEDDTFDFAQWPPSAGFAFALLPYVRSLYNLYYQKVWAVKAKKWLKEIQPRTAQNPVDTGGNIDPDQRQAAGDDGNVFEVHIDGGIWDDFVNEREFEDAMAANNALNNGAAQPAPLQADDDGAPAPDVVDNRPLPGGGANEQAVPQRQAPPAAAQVERERRVSFSPTAIASSVLGAVAFPTIAGLSGEMLKLVLPSSWTSKGGHPGILRQKWARSLIGGCLFVVCKDAIMLYVRWRMAQMHRKRSIVDFERRNRGAAA